MILLFLPKCFNQTLGCYWYRTDFFIQTFEHKNAQVRMHILKFNLILTETNAFVLRILNSSLYLVDEKQKTLIESILISLFEYILLAFVRKMKGISNSSKAWLQKNMKQWIRSNVSFFPLNFPIIFRVCFSIDPWKIENQCEIKLKKRGTSN